jgi:hypothetical protein
VNVYTDAARVAGSLAALRVLYAEHDARRERAIEVLEEETPICNGLAQRIDELEAKLESLRPHPTNHPARNPTRSAVSSRHHAAGPSPAPAVEVGR